MAKPVKKQSTSQIVSFIVADVNQLATMFHRWGEAVATAAGQTQARWQVLDAAAAADRTVAQLARRLGLARQSVQRTADLLVADGLAIYANNSDNRRSPYLRLTSPGTESLDKLSKTADASHKELAEGLRGQDLNAAQIVLRKFCIQLERDLNADQTGSNYSAVWTNRHLPQ